MKKILILIACSMVCYSCRTIKSDILTTHSEWRDGWTIKQGYHWMAVPTKELRVQSWFRRQEEPLMYTQIFSVKPASTKTGRVRLDFYKVSDTTNIPTEHWVKYFTLRK